MTPDLNPKDHTASGEKLGVHAPMALWTSITVGTAALMVLGIQPVLLGGLSQAGRLSAAQVGLAATVEVLALALGSAIGPRVLNGGAMRVQTCIICLLLAAVNLAMYATHTPEMIYVARGAAGLLEGLALGSAILVLTHAREPERVNGIFLAVQTIPQMVAAYLLPVLIVPRWGVNAAFLILAAMAVVAAVASFGLSNRVVSHVGHSAYKSTWSAPVLLAMAAVVFQAAGVGGAWTYVEVLAHQHDLATTAIGAAVAGTLATQILGAAFVAWIGWRAPFRIALIVGSLSQAALLVWLSQLTRSSDYILACCAFGLFWLALQPFQVRQLIDLDPSRRAALLLVPLVLIGSSLGPVFASLFVAPDNVQGGFWAASGLLGVSASLYFLTGTLWRGQHAVQIDPAGTPIA